MENTNERPSRAGAFPRRYPYSTLLAVTLLAAVALLLLQPIASYTAADAGFHVSKILRVSEGDWFIDPFSGTETIYPTLFHAVFGLLNRALRLDPHSLLSVIGLFDLVALFLSFFFFAKVVLGDTESASLAALCLGLVFYGPTGRFILLQNPANFCWPFLLCGFAFSCLYLRSHRAAHLAVGFFLLGVAVNVWWFSIFPAGIFVVVLLVYLPARKRLGWAFLAACLAGAAPFLFLAWHFYTIRGTLPSYLAGARREPIGLRMAVSYVATLLGRGNHQFRYMLLPFCRRVTWGSILASVHYYVMVLPFNLFLLFGAAVLYLRRRRSSSPDPVRLLLLAAAMATLVASALVLVVGNVPHLRRVQFAAFMCLLVFAVPYLRGGTGGGKRVRRLVTVFAVGSIFYTVAHGSDEPGGPPPETRQVVRLIEGLPNHKDERIFLLETSVRELTPFVTFKSFVGFWHGRYYSQDPVSADELFDSYIRLTRKDPDWRGILQRHRAGILMFRPRANALEADLAEFYRRKGRTVLENASWVVISME